MEDLRNEYAELLKLLEWDNSIVVQNKLKEERINLEKAIYKEFVDTKHKSKVDAFSYAKISSKKMLKNWNNRITVYGKVQSRWIWWESSCVLWEPFQ